MGYQHQLSKVLLWKLCILPFSLSAWCVAAFLFVWDMILERKSKLIDWFRWSLETIFRMSFAWNLGLNSLCNSSSPSTWGHSWSLQRPEAYCRVSKSIVQTLLLIMLPSCRRHHMDYCNLLYQSRNNALSLVPKCADIWNIRGNSGVGNSRFSNAVLWT